MSYQFEICFNQEFKSLYEFEDWIKESLLQHGLHGEYTIDQVNCYIAQDCQVFQAASESPEVKIALLKTVCLEILETLQQNSNLEKKRNRQEFDAAIKVLFDGKSRDAQIFCASITRQLRQFRLGKTYDAKEIVAEAYTRGVRKIEAGETINNPLGWLRIACLNVIREFQRKQISLNKPKLDKDPWSPGGIVFSQLILQEDFLAIQKAVEELSPEEQQLLYLRIEGLSWKSVGEQMPDPLREGTARQRGARIFEKLERMYAEIREDIQLPED